MFGSGCVTKKTWFYLVLSVFVVPSVSVESAMESNDVLNDVFLRCSFERYDDSVPLEETAPQPALRCRLRHSTGRRDLLGAEASGRHALHGETLLCGSHHVVRRLENTCGSKEMWLVVCEYVIKSVMCVSVQYGQKC